MRLKTCYGLCSLRTGVKIVAVYEMMTYTILFFISIFVSDIFSKNFLLYDDVNMFYFLQLCLIVVTLLKLFSTVYLMQATFRNAPYKIFLWIVIACVTYLAIFIVAIKVYVNKFYLNQLVGASTELDLQLECKLLFGFILINVVSVIEIHIVASFYMGEKQSEEADHRTRVQNLISSHMTTHSLNRHRPDVFYSDYAGSSIMRRPRAQSSFFSSFKGRPSYRYDVPTNFLSV